MVTWGWNNLQMINMSNYKKPLICFKRETKTFNNPTNVKMP